MAVQQHLQPPSHPHRPRIVLSKAARATLALERRQKSSMFKDALDSAWSQIHDTTMEMAVSHRKNLYFRQTAHHMRRTKANAWNAFFWKKGQEKKENQELVDSESTGRARLPCLIQDFGAEYDNLDDDDKATLLKEFEAFRELKSSGFCISARSKINDVTHTLKMVENKLTSLHVRTSTETILFTTHGSMNLLLNGVAFATEGVEDFLGSVMHLNKQDLISKMEGYALQGVQEDITGEPAAKMQWAHYFRNIVARYMVVIEGWPDDIPFANLSTVSSSQLLLEVLLWKWELDTIYWKKLTEEEYQDRHDERNKQLESGGITEATRRQRSDKGGNHKRLADEALGHQGGHTAKRKTYRSADTINSDDESSHNGSSATTQTERSILNVPSLTADDYGTIHMNLDGPPMFA
ncbi:hypothetical protein BU15DRAFT_65425 [Melanogaster broomeanus]|nr:hypothetical protein BU15DRAFT_65425 [Melanogaster broomeanus]